MENNLEKQNYLVISFESSVMAYHMEKLRRQDKLDGRLIPLPKSISAGCGAAFATKNMDREFWQNYMNDKKITYSGFYDVIL